MRIIPLILLFIFTLSAAVSAQRPLIETYRWLFVTTAENNIKHFIRNDVENIGDNLFRSWNKSVTQNGAYYITQTVWDCKNMAVRTLSTADYDRTGRVVSSKKLFEDWEGITADSIGEGMLNRACGRADLSYWVEIRSSKTNMRQFPQLDSPILRFGDKGGQFRIVSRSDDGYWYNVVDEKTQKDYWVHESTVKIFRVE